MTTIAHGLSMLLARDERAVINPKRCCYCGEFYGPDGKIIRPKPFIAANVSDGCCPDCYPKKLAEARETARGMR